MSIPGWLVPGHALGLTLASCMLQASSAKSHVSPILDTGMDCQAGLQQVRQLAGSTNGRCHPFDCLQHGRGCELQTVVQVGCQYRNSYKVVS